MVYPPRSDRLLRADQPSGAERTLLDPTMTDEYFASARDLTIRNQRHRPEPYSACVLFSPPGIRPAHF